MSSGGSKPIPGLLLDATVADLDVAWQERDHEAGTLAAVGLYAIALVLRLYALEIRIKVRICKQLNLTVLPKACKTHDLAQLMIFTGLFEQLSDSANLNVKLNWDKLVAYSGNHLDNLRYLPQSRLDPAEYDELIKASDDSTEGVLQWLSQSP